MIDILHDVHVPIGVAFPTALPEDSVYTIGDNNTFAGIDNIEPPFIYDITPSFKNELKYKVIAVDFDNTIAYSNEKSYPYITHVNDLAIKVLKEYQSRGGKVILWTCRTDNDLQIAIDEMLKYNMVFDAINRDLDNVIESWRKKRPHSSISPKIFCDLYIDDKAYPNNIRGIDWVCLREELLKMK